MFQVRKQDVLSIQAEKLKENQFEQNALSERREERAVWRGNLEG